jgi:hypothetical protein
MHTLLDLRGAIPAFIHISDGKMHEVKVLDFMPVEAGAFYVMDRGSSIFPGCTSCIRPGLSSSHAPNAE